MQALVMTEFGRLELQTLPIPQMVRPDDVLLEIQAAGVCGSDLHGYTGATGRRTPPLVMGHEATGRVLSVGPCVTDVQQGARVALMPLLTRREIGALRGRVAGLLHSGRHPEHPAHRYAIPWPPV